MPKTGNGSAEGKGTGLAAAGAGVNLVLGCSGARLRPNAGDYDGA